MFKVKDLVQEWQNWGSKRYKKRGKSSRVSQLRPTLRRLVAHFGRVPVNEFRSRKLREFRDLLIDYGLSRTNVNEQVNNIRYVFRWGVTEEYVQPDTMTSLDCLPPLPKGCEVRESFAKGAVSLELVAQVLPDVPSPVDDMVRVQLSTGMRPGEVCNMEAEQISQDSDSLWIYKPPEHKTKHIGHERLVPIGRRAMAIIWKHHRHGVVFRNPGGKNQFAGNKYNTDSYRRAVHRVCKRLRVELWSPNQLRKRTATDVRRALGIAGAQLLLGHTDSATTERYYAEPDLSLLSRIIEVVPDVDRL